ncbi:MAG TPA: sulfotransferase, partial [Sphingomonas sp.]|nr:sulfotransferase [Sphingomonas sp.]
MFAERLPEFIVVGAAKAATTWIAHHLRERPDVFLPGPEPHFYSRFYDKGFDWYAKCFRGAQPEQKVGEKSADYLAHPDVPARLAATIPGVRLVVQLRNPIDRAYSDYCMFYRRGTVGSDVERHLRAGSAKYPRFLEDGLYYRHLSRFLEHFP